MISVIIPVYNVEPYLDKCLASVEKQSYTDWECILIDDGSTDRSGIICDEWASRDSRFKVLHKKNEGVSIARNTGIKEVKGEYICFIDSDDWVTSTYLMSMISEIQSTDVDYLVAGIKKYYPNCNRKIDVVEPSASGIYPLDSTSTDIFVNNIGLVYGPFAKMYKTDTIQMNGVFFPQEMSLGEDMVFNFSYISKCKTIKYVQCANYYYRQQEDGLCNKYRDNFFEELSKHWEYRVAILKNKGMWNVHAERYFSKQLWGYVYDCIFSFGPQSYGKIRTIIGKIDVGFIKKYKEDFDCAQWIKFCILNKISFPLYLATHRS